LKFLFKKRYENHLVSNGQSIGEEAELRFVKEQLRNADNNVAYLSERVTMHRVRWLEEYYCANNLESHMPSDIHVAILPQIPVGAPSPTFFPSYSDGDGEYSEQHSNLELGSVPVVDRLIAFTGIQ
jgi:hypothetical protein